MRFHHLFEAARPPLILLLSIILLAGCGQQMEFPDYNPSGIIENAGNQANSGNENSTGNNNGSNSGSTDAGSNSGNVISSISLANTREGEEYIPAALSDTDALMLKD